MNASTLNDLGALIQWMGLKERIREAMGDRTAAELARATGVTAGAVSQWLDGTIKSLSADKAAKIEAATGYRASWLATGKGPKKTGEAASSGPTLQPILAWEHEHDLPEGDYVLIPKLNVHLSAGGGKDQIEIELAEATPLAFRSDWMRKMRLSAKGLAAMTATGRSMEPTIWDGDSLVIDTSQTDVQDGLVYALWYEGGERVKRLYRMPGGGLRIRSDNAADHPEILLAPEYVGHVRIIGRVVHRSGVGGL